MFTSHLKAKRRVVPSFDWRRPHHWIAYGFGAGLVPWAPGTFGTLAAVPLYLLTQPLPLGWYLGLLALMFLVGVWACGKTARELDADDPSAIVWDELLGYLVAMTAAPAGWEWVLLGFVLFRLLDILKPWPISAIERGVRGGLGVILDDLIAGVMTMAVIHLVGALVDAA